MSITIQSCASCRTPHFPFRLLCPACGNDAFTTVEKHSGTIEQFSTLSDGTIIGNVLVDDGPRVVARLGLHAQVGAHVFLTDHPEIGPDNAFVPIPKSRHHENEQ